MNYENITLSEKAKKSLLQANYKKLTDIQLKVIPSVLEGKDIIAQSQTGSGKTAAFLIPILEKLEVIGRPQVLILVPTRELVLQVSREAEKLSFDNKLVIAAIYGGEPIYKQVRVLRQGADIIVGTPGRIIDHLERGNLKTESLKVLVLDEVDEMINKGFLPDVERIIKKIPTKRQTLLFSATIPEVEAFGNRFLQDYQLIISETKPNDIQHYYIEVLSSKKLQALTNLLLYHFNKQETTLIFANQKNRVEEIGESLKRKLKKELSEMDKSKETNKNLTSLKADYISSNFRQNVRTRILSKFRDKKIFTLVATDVLGRGIDIENIDYVINYDFPQSFEAYTHRIGRTGRAGMKGKAITFVGLPREKERLFAISRRQKFKLEKFELF